MTETTEAMASTQSEIRALLDRWSDTIWHKDIDRLLTLYAPDSVYFDVVPPLQHKGTDAIRRNFLRWFAGWTSGIGQDVHDVTIWTSGGIAVASMLIRASGTLTDGREVGYWVRATVGCQRSGQEWLIVHEHVSLPVDFARGRAAMDLEP